jgi:hypothetical protein
MLSGTSVALSGMLVTGMAMAAPPPRVGGVYGSANGVPATMAPPSGLCATGTPSAVTGQGPWFWSCKGSRGGKTAQCSAPLKPASPTLTITFAPPDPTIQAASPLGTFVSTVTAAWSDGRPFTGTLQFIAPYFDDDGAFALAGNDIVVAQDLNGDGGTVQRISLDAAP